MQNKKCIDFLNSGRGKCEVASLGITEACLVRRKVKKKPRSPPRMEGQREGGKLAKSRVKGGNVTKLISNACRNKYLQVHKVDGSTSYRRKESER